ncbi:DUF3857 domain-containing protein [Arcticibacter tournemirensis]|uniref:DUF3857 domain-containing protein n=1 Tax=Arcticibacter tournemirensis TaxID=699437 RepID=A0A4Q0M5J7_9SPHI|nr:DUF3857 domain-containing protein [Arcticibacter tournemirensis]RXF68009.1 DUF3857 domain-containing protein [Arcticibacter tournemirensis]
MMVSVLKKSLAALTLLLSTATYTYSQKTGIAADLYNSSGIPDSLKKDANSVVRYYSMEMTVKGPARATLRQHSVETILNEKAEEKALMVIGYNKKFSSVNGAEMIVYDASGKLIKRYKKSDMYDRSAVDNISIITDGRVLVTKHNIVSYPITIEKIYEKSLNSFLDLGDWNIQEEEEAVQNASFKVSVNPGVGFRYKVKNIKLQPRKSTEDGMDVFSWEVKNLKAIKLEEDSKPWKVLPHISFATNNIEFDGLPGDMSTWKGFGIWQQTLNKDVSSLSPQREEEIKKMVAGFANDKEKARFLYEYMQKNTRYVSIQLGIGGLKPFSAAFVDEKKYGDCKALTNYMYTLLKIAGIKSYYTLIRAGENEEPADEDFVNDSFNHIVLCVPFKNDTTWLECTSTTNPFGKLGTFTENRNALIVTEEGGKLVNTPASKLDDNVFDSQTTITVGDDGIARTKVAIKATGEYRDMYIHMSTLKADEQKKFLINALNLRQPDLFELSHQNDKDGIKEILLDLAYTDLSDMKAGNKYFYKPRVFDIYHATFPPTENRKTDFYFPHPMLKKNTTSIVIPGDFEVESLPADVDMNFSYGSYKVKYLYDAGKHEINSTTIFTLKNHVIPAAKYSEMQKFMDDISKSMSKKLVIKKKA